MIFRERHSYITCIGLVREAGRFSRGGFVSISFFLFFLIFSRFLFDGRVQKKNTESLSASSQVGSQREPSTFHINATNLFIEFSHSCTTHISLIFHQNFLDLNRFATITRTRIYPTASFNWFYQSYNQLTNYTLRERHFVLFFYLFIFKKGEKRVSGFDK